MNTDPKPRHEDSDELCRAFVHPVAMSIATELSLDFGFTSGVLSGLEPIFEGIELSMSDKEIIAGRIRQKVCDVLATACGEHVVCT